MLNFINIELMLISLSVSISIALFNLSRASVIKINNSIILTDLIITSVILTVFS